ncbi:MAG: hypothetical protein JWM97_1817 [Phycisphaerales bacterium]|nr:hypothetical protein [Phycisphaerales bacterium]
MTSRAVPPRYRQGRILWAWLRSGSGRKEKHPCAIITADRDIVQPELFDPREDLNRVNAVAVIGISTEFKKYPPYIQLPHAPGGHATTGLTQNCGACIGWYDWVVLEDDVLGRGGDVPSIAMDEIMIGVADDLRKSWRVRPAVFPKSLLESMTFWQSCLVSRSRSDSRQSPLPPRPGGRPAQQIGRHIEGVGGHSKIIKHPSGPPAPQSRRTLLPLQHRG